MSEQAARVTAAGRPRVLRAAAGSVSGAIAAALLVAAASAPPASAQEVGRFSIVTNQVTSLKPGAAQAVPAGVGARIVLDETETTGARSAAQMTFGEGAIVSIGAETTLAVTRQVVDEATGASASTLDMIAGAIRVFVSRFWTERPEVRVTTPTAVVGIKGSEVVVEVLPDGTTRVTVLAGSCRVRSKEPGAGWTDMTAGETVEIGPGPPAPLLPRRFDLGLEAELIGRTSPVPDPGRDRPEGRPDGDYGPSGATTATTALTRSATAVATTSPASGGNGLTAPVGTNALPESPVKPCFPTRDQNCP